jgi:monothiol glutaredoxin
MGLFNILGKDSAKNEAATIANPEAPLNDRIKTLINSSNVMLFMKGNANAPQCGFSARVVEVLNHQGVNFKTFDILSDGDIRQGVKEYSNWPTYPQLYVKGVLVGGCDIIMELAESGELAGVLKA